MTATAWARPTKTWAALAADGVTVASLGTFDAALVPGTDIPATWAKDVTSVAGIETDWTLSGTTFVAPAPTQAQLVAYASAKQVALRDGGITVNIGTASTPDEVDVASDVVGRGLVSGCVQLVGLASQGGQPAPSFPWINGNGTQLTLTSAQMMTIATDLGNFVQATYAALGTVLAAVAGGTITSYAGIDTASWPATAF